MPTFLQLLILGLLVAGLGCVNNATTPPGGNEPSPSTSHTTPSSHPAAAGHSPPGTADKVAEETHEALQATGEFAAQAKDEFVAEVQAQIKKLDQQVAEMEKKSETLSAESRAKWDAAWQDVHQRRQELQAKLDELGQSSGEAWKELRAGTTAAWNDFQQAVRNATAEFETQPHTQPQPQPATP